MTAPSLPHFRPAEIPWHCRGSILQPCTLLCAKTRLPRPGLARLLHGGGTEGDGPSPGAPLNSFYDRHHRGIQKHPRDSRAGALPTDAAQPRPPRAAPPRGPFPSAAPAAFVRGAGQPRPACARPRVRRWETVPYAGKFGVGFKAPPSGEADCGAPGNRSEGARRGEARGAGSRGRHKWSGGGGGGGGGGGSGGSGGSRRRGGRCRRCGQSCALRSAAA